MSKRIKINGKVYNIKEVCCKENEGYSPEKKQKWFEIEKAPKTWYVSKVKFDDGRITSDPLVVKKAYIYVKDNPEAFMPGELKGMLDLKEETLKEWLESWDK